MAAVAVIFATTAIRTDVGIDPALVTKSFDDSHQVFFIFTRRVNWMVRFASFSKPCTRRIAFLSARGLAMFILRLRTQRVRVALSR